MDGKGSVAEGKSRSNCLDDGVNPRGGYFLYGPYLEDLLERGFLSVKNGL